MNLGCKGKERGLVPRGASEGEGETNCDRAEKTAVGELVVEKRKKKRQKHNLSSRATRGLPPFKKKQRVGAGSQLEGQVAHSLSIA